MHDLWHVLSGYETDEAGEMALLWFSRAAGIKSRGLRWLSWVSVWLAPKSDFFYIQRYLAAAWLRGRRASSLLAAPYEDLLATPIDEVRKQLRIGCFAESHPAGPLYWSASVTRSMSPRAEEGA
jgi:ubiquinone biosynthesis protein COQ4